VKKALFLGASFHIQSAGRPLAGVLALLGGLDLRSYPHIQNAGRPLAGAPRQWYGRCRRERLPVSGPLLAPREGSWPRRAWDGSAMRARGSSPETPETPERRRRAMPALPDLT